MHVLHGEEIENTTAAKSYQKDNFTTKLTQLWSAIFG